MATRAINWTRQALIDRIEILEYWINRNKSHVYSKKLDSLFVATVELLSQQPEIGRKNKDTITRSKIIKDYFIIYDYNEYEIDILVIWNSRRNPKNLKKRLEK